ncbi:MAG: NusG domain II-containing protein [Butyrivibrio sp.]|uniref:NusG domain II-containing protein n=1 Tax=Butyrivibrio sp. TaxID=28121 RepID=UPI0025E4FF57|nr:NusG domain II-containing protein [Butyrivibrio sp.]MCR5771033.1 NusG domain II-containing protein [Butyrivibrio sp.]
MKTDNKKLKAEIILVVIIIGIAAFLYLYMNFVKADKGATVQILVDGQVTEEYDLYSSREVVIDTGDGGQNVLIIDNGRCYMDDANCPDKLCVSQGIISKSGQSIICLPHKLVITISGGEEQEVDTVSQ